MASSVYLYGYHCVWHLLKQRPQAVKALWLDKSNRVDGAQPLQQLVQSLGLSVQLCDKEQLTRMAQSSHHQGMVVQATLPGYKNEAWLDECLPDMTHAFFVVLDGVTDPHNLGAVLRSSAAFGVDGIIVPKDKSASLTPASYKVACGGAEYVPILRVTNLARCMHGLRDQGVWIYGAAESGSESLHQVSFSQKLAWVFGSEGKGLRRLTEACCDHLIKIPTTDRIVSLNVSAAMATCAYEVRRQIISSSEKS